MMITTFGYDTGYGDPRLHIAVTDKTTDQTYRITFTQHNTKELYRHLQDLYSKPLCPNIQMSDNFVQIDVD